MEARLKVTSKGQVTLRKELLDHLGVRPGDTIVVESNGPGTVEVRAASGLGIERLFGLLESPDGIRLTLDEIQTAIAEGWAGKR